MRSEWSTPSGPRIIAHRGARDVAPENTLAAFQAALEAGADAIELDVMPCASGELVVIHDATVDRTTDGSGRVADLSLEEIRALDAGSWFDASFTGERIPLLSEVLAHYAHRLLINVEIKVRSGAARVAREVVALLRAHRAMERVLISSFNPFVLWHLRRMVPDLPRGLLYTSGWPPPWDHAGARWAVQPWALHPQYERVNEAYVRWAHGQGYRVHPWTVNEAPKMARLLDLGVDALITDHPARAHALREAMPKPDQAQ